MNKLPSLKDSNLNIPHIGIIHDYLYIYRRLYINQYFTNIYYHF
jgi:hypothetical protein